MGQQRAEIGPFRRAIFALSDREFYRKSCLRRFGMDNRICLDLTKSDKVYIGCHGTLVETLCVLSVKIELRCFVLLCNEYGSACILVKMCCLVYDTG